MFAGVRVSGLGNLIAGMPLTETLVAQQVIEAVPATPFTHPHSPPKLTLANAPSHTNTHENAHTHMHAPHIQVRARREVVFLPRRFALVPLVRLLPSWVMDWAQDMLGVREAMVEF